MKDFKFRAWDGEKMHYNVVPWQWDFCISLSWHKCERSTGSGVLGSGGKEGDFLVPGIAFKELMQFTGLKDKNGTEIYKGDIVEYVLPKGEDENEVDVGYTEEVVFENGCFNVEGNTPLYAVVDWDAVVVGNIHENPDLLA